MTEDAERKTGGDGQNAEAVQQREGTHCIFTLHLLHMNSLKLVIPLHSLYWSIHTKDESKRGTAFAFIFGVN